MSGADTLRRWRLDPVQFVRDNFHVEPNEWQKDVLRTYGDPARPRVRLSMQACAGPGKTAVLAWCAWHFMATVYDPAVSEIHRPEGIAISISGDNLEMNLWKELSIWRDASAFLTDQFRWTATKVFHKDHPEKWRIMARSYAKTANPEQQGNVLSGLHSPWILYLCDEIGDMNPIVKLRAEQGLMQTATVFGRILGAGNPTALDGLLHDIATNPEGWDIIRITGDPDDPKRSPRIDLEETRKIVTQRGRDDPWVQAYILGMFPSGGINQLLTPDEVQTAMGRNPSEDQFGWAQKRIGVDVSRYGMDPTILFPRQGIVAFQPVEMRHARDSAVSVNIGNRVLAMKQQWGSEVEFFDDTVGWAHGAIDYCRVNGGNPMPVKFDDTRTIDSRYYNRRAEIWMRMADWIRFGNGTIPNIPRLQKELCAVTYGYKGGKYLLESKDDIKKRLGHSLDYSDALALTFSAPDVPASTPGTRAQRGKTVTAYDPHAGIM